MTQQKYRHQPHINGPLVYSCELHLSYDDETDITEIRDVEGNWLAGVNGDLQAKGLEPEELRDLLACLLNRGYELGLETGKLQVRNAMRSVLGMPHLCLETP